MFLNFECKRHNCQDMEDHSESTHALSSDDNLAAGGGLSSHSTQDTSVSEEHPQTGSSLFGAVDTDNAQGSPGSPRTRPVTGAGRSRHGVVRAQRRRESPPPPPPPPEFGDGPVVGQPAARVPTPPTAAAATATTMQSHTETPSSLSPTSCRTSPRNNDETSNRKGLEGRPDCAICLQTCVHPVQLPCQHVFCFLCAKGAIKNSRRCAMCRSEVPADYLDNPLLLDTEQLQLEMALTDGYQWFYEGRNGWWKYDERTAADLEAAFTGGEKRAELLVAGYRYVVDFETMLQLRRSDPARRRRVKRDLASAAKKGVAGIRAEGAAAAETETGLEGALQAVALAAPAAGGDDQRPADRDGSTRL
ncbi:E3 ubiquitin-protein ligase rnf146-like isoform X3 [Amphibalanus amphitrite]|uniref:E3 ubiquitin-protein ligase rnf146-like isoform X3 n=1 Tax=Amphibalanus amphitrite TaxID=1232801 RepID=UPI001C8FC0C0|nr:E3 ubiquitin-protein ligase rnf146-like isoform X3 [Amphibalanus amphitrite]